MGLMTRIAEWYEEHKFAKALSVSIPAVTAAEIALEFARPQAAQADFYDGFTPPQEGQLDNYANINQTPEGNAMLGYVPVLKYFGPSKVPVVGMAGLPTNNGQVQAAFGKAGFHATFLEGKFGIIGLANGSYNTALEELAGYGAEGYVSIDLGRITIDPRFSVAPVDPLKPYEKGKNLKDLLSDQYGLTLGVGIGDGVRIGGDVQLGPDGKPTWSGILRIDPVDSKKYWLEVFVSGNNKGDQSVMLRVPMHFDYR